MWVRGYTADGLVDARFRGRNIARNAVFCDLMVRTGLRLQEQASLTVFDVPRRDGHRGYYRWWLPAAIAKYGSARSIYTPDGVLRDLWTYIEVDRAEAVRAAQRAGRYEQIVDALVVEEPARASARVGGRPVGVDRLNPHQRRRLLLPAEAGLEPAALWLGEDGMPLGVRAWKSMFRTASDRCRSLGVDISCHAHLLRHTFAVTTLEHLQRGHLAVLGEMNPQQRRHYQMVFGDPLDWIRRRLGHRSIETTAVYLHVLAKLEMATRLALVSDAWEDPRLLRADDLAVEEASLTDTATEAAA
jgi:integrase